MEETKTKNKDKILKVRFHVVAIICIVLFAIAIAPKTLQNDTYYTIKIGEYISKNGISNLTQDPFSWHNLPYTFPHWLYDFMMFNIYNVFSWDGIYASTIVFGALLGIFMYMVCNKLSKNSLFSLVGTLLGMYCLKPYIAARAQLVTFILFLITILCIEKFLDTGKKRYGILLILIPILIANLHVAVWPFYFVLYLPYIAEYIISLDIINIDLFLRLKILVFKVLNKFSKLSKFKFGEKIENEKEKIAKHKENREKIRENPYKIKVERNKNGKWLILIALICILTGLLTPIGTTTPYTYLYKTMTGNTTKVINEHLPLTLINNKQCTVFLIVTLAILIFTDTKVRAKNIFFLIGLIALTFMTRRQFSMLTLFGIPIVVEMFSNLFDNHIPKLNKKLFLTFSGVVGMTLILCIVTLVSVRFYKQKKNDVYITNNYPISAAEWIKNNLDLKQIRLFNEYNYGSYLLFQDIPVMIDSRCDLYTPEFNSPTGKKEDGRDIFMDVQRVVTISTNHEAVFNHYGITHVISYSNSKLSMILRRDNRYKILFNRDGFTIFERNV